MKLCRCGGFYRRGNYNFHTNSWIHKLYKVLKRRATDEELLRFQYNFVDEDASPEARELRDDLIDDISSTTSTKLPESEMTDYDSN